MLRKFISELLKEDKDWIGEEITSLTFPKFIKKVRKYYFDKKKKMQIAEREFNLTDSEDEDREIKEKISIDANSDYDNFVTLLANEMGQYLLNSSDEQTLIDFIEKLVHSTKWQEAKSNWENLLPHQIADLVVRIFRSHVFEEERYFYPGVGQHVILSLVIYNAETGYDLLKKITKISKPEIMKKYTGHYYLKNFSYLRLYKKDNIPNTATRDSFLLFDYIVQPGDKFETSNSQIIILDSDADRLPISSVYYHVNKNDYAEIKNNEFIQAQLKHDQKMKNWEEESVDVNEIL